MKQQSRSLGRSNIFENHLGGIIKIYIIESDNQLT